MVGSSGVPVLGSGDFHFNTDGWLDGRDEVSLISVSSQGKTVPQTSGRVNSIAVHAIILQQFSIAEAMGPARGQQLRPQPENSQLDLLLHPFKIPPSIAPSNAAP